MNDQSPSISIINDALSTHVDKSKIPGNSSNNEEPYEPKSQKRCSTDTPDSQTVIVCHQKVNLKFENLSYWANILMKKERKQILRNLTGEFHSAEMIALMGPSGAGKTTLLNILAGSKTRGKSSGEILVNGRSREVRKFKKISCYIMQDTALLPYLSVLETMHVALALKLGNRLAGKEQNEIIQKILMELGLMKCKDSSVVHLSGGERKRLSIAQELVSNPPIMFFDEPTSGLDSVSSYQCMSVLKNLAHRGHLVVCSIHQPSALMFELFDKIYMLTDGQCIYRGAVKGLVPFLALEAGLNCPTTHNPADYVLEVACGEHGDVINKLVSAVDNADDQSSSTTLDKLLDNSDVDFKDFPTSQWTQFNILIQRSAKCIVRDRIHLIVIIGTYLLSGLITGLLYYGIGNDAALVYSNGMYCGYCLMFLFYCTLMAAVITFPSQMAVYEREHLNSWYSLKSLYFATSMAEIPLQVFCAIAFLSATYYITDQPMEMWRFSSVLLIGVLSAIVGQSIGLLIGVIMNIKHGIVIGAALGFLLVLFSGYFVRFSGMPTFIRWFTHISHLRYSLEGIMLAIYSDREKIPCFKDVCIFRSPIQFLRYLEMDDGSFWLMTVRLVVEMFVLRLCVYLILKYKLRT